MARPRPRVRPQDRRVCRRRHAGCGLREGGVATEGGAGEDAGLVGCCVGCGGGGCLMRRGVGEGGEGRR